ncbi:hypothetical protein C1H46_000384 [Malus baccata]|uniref:Uncharacterized protein n=1 Tax=Malus baccata TaxID=106549 RepID=A0A540NSF3_MALBA|nr:hypothetical protein C1H46_000384 [Malus baccata]
MLGGGSRWGRTKGLLPRVAASSGRGSVDPLRQSSDSRRLPPLGLTFAGSYSAPLSFLGIQRSKNTKSQIQIKIKGIRCVPELGFEQKNAQKKQKQAAAAKAVSSERLLFGGLCLLREFKLISKDPTRGRGRDKGSSSK